MGSPDLSPAIKGFEGIKIPRLPKIKPMSHIWLKLRQMSNEEVWLMPRSKEEIENLCPVMQNIAYDIWSKLGVYKDQFSSDFSYPDVFQYLLRFDREKFLKPNSEAANKNPDNRWALAYDKAQVAIQPKIRKAGAEIIEGCSKKLVGCTGEILANVADSVFDRSSEIEEQISRLVAVETLYETSREKSLLDPVLKAYEIGAAYLNIHKVEEKIPFGHNIETSVFDAIAIDIVIDNGTLACLMFPSQRKGDESVFFTHGWNRSHYVPLRSKEQPGFIRTVLQ